METKRFSNYWLNKYYLILGAVFLTAPFFHGQQNLILNPNIDSIVDCGLNGSITEGNCEFWNVYGEGESEFICEGTTNLTIQYFASLKQSHSWKQHLINPILTKANQSYFCDNFWDTELPLHSNITGTFNHQLESGQRYKISMFVSEMGYGVNTEYVHIFTNCFDMLLLDSLNTPVINNQQYASLYPDSFIINLNPSNELIKDSINWIEISTCFIAKGGEKHFVVGCLRDSTKIITEVYRNPQNMTAYNTSVYAFDTFSLYECDTCCGNSPPIPPFEEGVLVANNPSTSDKPIQFKVSIPATKSAKIAIYDNAGRLIEEAYLTSDSSLFSPTKKYARGMYYYSFISSTGYSKIGKWLQM